MNNDTQHASFVRVTKEELTRRLKLKETVSVIRTKDWVPFEVTGVGDKVFIIKDRHGLEHTRQFNGPWVLEEL